MNTQPARMRNFLFENKEEEINSTPAQPSAAQVSPATLTFKLSVLLIPFLIYGGYHWYQNTEAETIINTTIDSNDDLANSLVLHYTFDGPDTNWSSSTAEILDTSGNAAHGNATNFTASAVTPGTIGQALKFDGSDDVITTSQAVTGTTTIALWVRAPNINTANYRSLVTQAGGTGLYYRDGGPGFRHFNYYCDAGNHNSSTTNLTANTWYHISVSIVGDRGTFYLNGQNDGSFSCTSASFSSLGIGNGGGFAFDGSIDDVRIYNRTLSASEVKRLYELGATTHINTTVDTNDDLENGLALHWTFDGIDTQWSSTTREILDRSGSDNHGLVNNGGTEVVSIGKIGQGILLNGNTQSVSQPANVSTLRFSSTSFAFGGWFNPLEDQDIQTILTWDAGSVDRYWINIDNGGAESLSCSVNLSTTDAAVVLNTTVKTGNWYHLYCVYDDTAKTAKLYINGQLASTSNPGSGGITDGASGGNFSLVAGCTSEGIGCWNTKIDDIRVYNRIVSDSEVKRLYELGATTHINTTIDTNDDLESGLVGHWTFDGPKMAWGSSTAEVLDNGSGGQELDATNMDTNSVAIGKMGQALKFDGSNDLLDGISPGISGTTSAFSVSLWIKTAGAISDYGGLVEWSDSSNRRYGVDLDQTGDPLIVYATATASTRFREATGANADDGNWHHIVGIYTDPNAQPVIYMDTVNRTLGSEISPAAPLVANDLKIGNLTGPSKLYSGTIDDVRIYNRTLSPAEVKRLYELGGGR